MRQLVYLPQASIFVAEIGSAWWSEVPSWPFGRRSAPGVSSAPSICLVVDPDHDADRVTAALLEEVIRSASNKGCTVVEAIGPTTRPLARWQRPWVHRGRSAHPTNRGRGRSAARRT